MIWAIGLDDTDYPTGGCTTWQANELEKVLIQCGAKPIERRSILEEAAGISGIHARSCLLYTSPSPRDRQKSRMPSSA